MANNTEDVELRKKLVSCFYHPEYEDVTVDTEAAINNLERLFQQEANRQKAELLESIGGPTLQDVGKMQPEQYQGGLIIDKWYKARIEEMRKQLEQGGK